MADKGGQGDVGGGGEEQRDDHRRDETGHHGKQGAQAEPSAVVKIRDSRFHGWIARGVGGTVRDSGSFGCGRDFCSRRYRPSSRQGNRLVRIAEAAVRAVADVNHRWVGHSGAEVSQNLGLGGLVDGRGGVVEDYRVRGS